MIASTGAGIQGNPVCLPVTAQPGHSYVLGTVYVVNTGSGTENIAVSATALWPGQGGNARDLAPAPAWITVSYPKHDLFLSSSSVSLPPGQGAYLAVTLTIPASARHGVYDGNLVAGVTGNTPAGNGTRADLGAAAATGLKFGAGVPAPSCGIPAPSAAAVADAKHAAEVGDMVPAATAPSAKTPYAGWAILILLGMVVLAGLRRLMR